MKHFGMMLVIIDRSIRAALCRRYHHKFYVGQSGYYVGMPQAWCWRCGAVNPYDNVGGYLPLWRKPSGRWFS